MEIQVGGRVWEVETKASPTINSKSEAFRGVTFRDPNDRETRVKIRWVPASGPLTSSAARRLFELAGERVWKDPRTAVVHRVLIEDGSDEVRGAHLIVRFITAAGSGATRYDLDVPLGMAPDEALQRLLDRALRRGPNRLGTD
jgi:hypothetical protein